MSMYSLEQCLGKTKCPLNVAIISAPMAWLLLLLLL